MSEPIKLFDADGNEVLRYSPAMAHLEVAAGLLFTVRPVVRIAAVVNGVIYTSAIDGVVLNTYPEIVDGITVSTLNELVGGDGSVIASTRRPIMYADNGGVRTYYFPDDTAQYIEVAPDITWKSPWCADEGMPALDGMPQEDDSPHAILHTLVPMCDEHGEVVAYNVLPSADTPHAVLGSITMDGSDQYAGRTPTAKRGRPRKGTGVL